MTDSLEFSITAFLRFHLMAIPAVGHLDVGCVTRSRGDDTVVEYDGSLRPNLHVIGGDEPGDVLALGTTLLNGACL